MSAKRFKWSLHARLADETFGIPPDVTFLIVENDQVTKIEAHKMLLGVVSPTFKLMLYTTRVGNNAAKEFEIKETTAPAFQTMIDAIYATKSIEDGLKGKTVKEVFDVMILIEQYQIVQLKEAVEELLANYPVTEDTVLEVAGEAMKYSTLFQKEVRCLLFACAKFLKPKLKTRESIFNYAAEYSDQKEVFAALLALMKDIPPAKCLNCNYEACQDGKEVKVDDFRIGLIIAANRDSDSDWGHADRGTGQVTRVEGERVLVESVVPGPVYKWDLIGMLDKMYEGNPRFLFACK